MLDDTFLWMVVSRDDGAMFPFFWSCVLCEQGFWLLPLICILSALMYPQQFPALTCKGGSNSGISVYMQRCMSCVLWGLLRSRIAASFLSFLFPARPSHSAWHRAHHYPSSPVIEMLHATKYASRRIPCSWRCCRAILDRRLRRCRCEAQLSLHILA